VSLKRIALRDFVIVRDLELELAGGFSVLTGETGAGKSILMDALGLCLGDRADAGLVRAGDYGEAGAEVQLQAGDDGKVADFQVREHGGRPWRRAAGGAPMAGAMPPRLELSCS